MGIAKFFAYISERYPALNEKIKENQIPDFDNLYLDMNGIIHTCTHPKDKDITCTMSEEEMFRSIFHYIEALFFMIKPQKMFFMALDGVAPRAKINQQRSRRFCSAKTAEMLEAKAIAQGNPIPEDQKFDSNCITPGTVFMDKLNKYLKYFVTHNISTNKLWQRCKVIFSGSEVAGEGEHKIMDYIRYMKSQPDYDVNTRHCLYGLDADLIMLGLCTHELHFALLREEIQFGKKQRLIMDPGQTQFYLFHISLMREYIEHEFAALKKTLPFAYDLDKIIDDWILIAFLIGNDFIPHVPNIYIPTDGIPILYDVYREIVPTLDGYINEGGTLNLERFEKFMEKLSRVDIARFSEHYADLKFLDSKRPACIENEDAPAKKPRNKELEALINSTMMMSIGDSFDEDGTEEDTERYMMEFAQHKKDYYMNKLNHDTADEKFLRTLTEDYIRAIQWNLYYYYEGCKSWYWFYPHHYAPYISDIKNFKDLKLEFDMGEPFLPFEQLLAVLPPYSRRLLPAAFQNLLVEEQSPIISYYPEYFETDLNGKRNDWEAVVLIPFINGDKLRDAMVPYYDKLTDDERARNKHGPMCEFTYSQEDLGIYKAPATYFPNVVNHAQMVLIDRSTIVVPKERLVIGLSAGVQKDVLYLGFATLKHVDHKMVLKKAEVKVFNQSSKWDNMILQIPEQPLPDLEALAKDLLGKPAYVNWPYLRRAKVVGVSDSSVAISLLDAEAPYSEKNLKRDRMKGLAATQWRSKAKRITDSYRESRGIEVGSTNIVIHACVSAGKKYTFQLEKESWVCTEQWYENPLSYPYQVLLRDLVYHEAKVDAQKSIADVLTPGTVCFMLGPHHYGAMAEVLPEEFNERWRRADKIRVSITVPPLSLSLQLALKRIMDSSADSRQRYMTGSSAAMLLGISSSFFARITGTIFVTEMGGESEPKLYKHNIGFNLKFNKKNEEIPGYTRKIDGQWYYSNKTVDLVRNYMKKYPELFERLWKVSWNDELCIFHADELFDKGSGKLSEVLAWLKENNHAVEKRACGAKALCPEVVQEIEKELDAFVEQEGKDLKQRSMHAKSWEIFVPGLHDCATMPDPNAKHRLFDRIINVRESSTIPLGHLGVIIAIQNDDGALDTIYEIVFDKPFPGGLAINGCSNFRGYRLPGSAFINISHGERETAQSATKGRQEQPTRRVPPNEKPQIHSDVSAFASVSVKNIRLAPEATPKIMRHLRNGNRDAEPAPPKNAKPASEFQALWNELHEKQKSNKSTPKIPSHPGEKFKQHPGKEFGIPGQDPSAFLRAILKINDVSTPQNKHAPGIPRSIVCLPPPANFNSRPPSLNSSGSTEDKAMDAPPLVKQMFHHAQQSKEIKERKMPIWYCSQLLNHYQFSRSGMPRYTYFTDGETNLIRAHIALPDNRVFVGDPSMTHEEAAGSAAKKVYTEVMQPDLKNLMPPPHQWFANVMNPPRGPPVRPPMMPSFHTKPAMGQPRFQHWHGKPTAPFQAHNQARPNQRPQEEAPKPEMKNSTAFVPLQAQKKNRKLSASKDTKKEEAQSKEKKEKSLESAAKEKSVEKQANSQASKAQDNQKVARPKKSRVAAKFGAVNVQKPEAAKAQST